MTTISVADAALIAAFITIWFFAGFIVIVFMSGIVNVVLKNRKKKKEQKMADIRQKVEEVLANRSTDEEFVNIIKNMLKDMPR